MGEQGNNITVEQDGDRAVLVVHQVTPSGVQRASIRLSPDEADSIGATLFDVAATIRGAAPGDVEGAPGDAGDVSVDGAGTEGVVSSDPNDKAV